jgi:hypothetical protein
VVASSINMTHSNLNNAKIIALSINRTRSSLNNKWINASAMMNVTYERELSGDVLLLPVETLDLLLQLLTGQLRKFQSLVQA